MSIRYLIRRSAIISVVSAMLTLGAAVRGMATPEHPAERSAANVQPVPAPGRLGPLVDLVIQRLLLSDQVAAAKFGTGSPIDDPVREQQELAQVRQDAVAMGIDPDATVRFFRQQISASKVVQRGLFELWTAHPGLAPTSRPDLTVLRGQLDQLTAALLARLATIQVPLRGDAACQTQLTRARLTGEAVNHLDHLHRRALSVALASLCPPMHADRD